LPEKRWKELRQEYIDGNKTWDKVLCEYNNPKNYQPENPSANKSRKYESSP